MQNLCIEYSNFIEKGVNILDPEITRVKSIANQMLNKHFDEKLIEEFDKEIKTEIKRSTDNSDHWGLVFLDIVVSGIQGVDQSKRDKVKYQNQFLILLRDCLRDYGLHSSINKRNADIYGRYSIRIEYQDKKEDWCHYYKMNLTKQVLLDKYITPYLNDNKLRLGGKATTTDKVNSIIIKKSLLKDEEIRLFLLKYNHLVKEHKSPEHKYFQLCPDVTEYVINEADVAITGIEAPKHATAYVHESRMEELMKAQSEYDLAPLIQLCEELNLSWSNGHYMTIPMQVRTIMNFVSPIFGCKNFEGVANNYSGGGSSFKKHMTFLQSSLKHVADGQLHMQATKKQALPNSISVDYSSPLDALLAQVINVSQ
ncbi:MAG: hypothetical protein OQK06_01370 [Flavobacteriales bacterium]|nr:hypothetical protein [Flavobacteriales bacterium]